MFTGEKIIYIYIYICIFKAGPTMNSVLWTSMFKSEILQFAMKIQDKVLESEGKVVTYTTNIANSLNSSLQNCQRRIFLSAALPQVFKINYRLISKFCYYVLLRHFISLSQEIMSIWMGISVKLWLQKKHTCLFCKWWHV